MKPPTSTAACSPGTSRVAARGEGRQTVGRILEAADAGQIELYVSWFTLVECLSQAPSRSPVVETEARVLALLDSERVVHIEFSRSVALRARDLFLTKRYKQADAIHIASAIEADADVLFTFDKDDFPIGSSVQDVWVDLPYLPGEPDLLSMIDE